MHAPTRGRLEQSDAWMLNDPPATMVRAKSVLGLSTLAMPRSPTNTLSSASKNRFSDYM
jgi:hypothetical protein